MDSFKGYGKVDELENQAYQKKTRKRMIILIVSSIVLGIVIVAGVAGTLLHTHNTSSSANSVPSSPGLTPAASLKAVCDVTRYPNSCVSRISSLPSYSNTTDPEILFNLSLRVAIDELSKLADYPGKLRSNVKDNSVQTALDVCGNVLEDAVDRLNDSISSLEVGGERRF